MLELKNISKTYKSKKSVDTNALNNINLKFDNKGLVFIVGKSGSGKSTLLNLIGGLDTPDSGQILIDGKDICKLKSKNLDSYRNSYVGFVFQEFNLFEELNVYENINLSLELQRKKDNDDIKKILKDVDLKDLEQRNINELSGGQKQRVSIARAIVKKPKLILADEPTGNLDRKSSEQIFKIMKQISENELVIIVSHDIESANKYADRIIRIEDGKIVNDSNFKKLKTVNDNIDFKESKLPKKYIFKMAYSYIMSKPFRLIMTILLTMITLSFLCFSINVYLFNENKLLINTMVDNDIYNLNINHINVEFENNNRKEFHLKIDDSDINYLNNLTNSISNKVYSLLEDGSSLTFKFGEVKEEYLENEAINEIPNEFKFVELKDYRIINKIIGSYPSNSNEIIVHKYFADYMIYNGIYTSDNELYLPNSYEEIVNSNKEIKLNNKKVIITGIVDDNKKPFIRAFDSGTFWSNDLRNYFRESYYNKSSLIYVTSSFINNINLSNELNLSKIKIVNSSNKTNSNIKVLNSSIQYYDLNGNSNNKNHLNQNEIILSFDSLKLFVEDFNKNLESFIKKNANLSYNEIIKRYTLNYIKNNNIDISLKLVNEMNKNEEIELNIVGVSLNDYDYISNQISNDSNLPKQVSNVIIYCDDTEVLNNIFDNLEVLYSKNYNKDGEKYRVSYDNSIRVSSIIFVYSFIKRYLFSLCLVFVCFTSLVILNFISNSITIYKKQIGILRSIGTRNKDVIKIFNYEAIILGTISWFFGVIVWVVECRVLNNSMFGNTYFILNGIVSNYMVPFIVLIFNILVSMMITIILINKINEVKPIDVILDRR